MNGRPVPGRCRGRTVGAVLATLLLAPASARAQEDTGWTISSFDVEYTIHPDRSIEVVERITVDFGGLRRHGIYRDIPVRYRRVASGTIPAGRVSVGLDVERVTDGEGNERQTEVTRGDEVRIRIGDPHRTVSGWQSYVVHYTLDGGLGFFDDHDEIYWQVTGTEWPVPIGNARATVSLPFGAATAFADSIPWGAECYAGWAESTSGERCTAEVIGAGRYRFSAGRLEPGEGLTLVGAFPKGVIAPPTAAERALNALFLYGPLGLPFLAAALLLALWIRYGREPDAGSVVPRWRAPEGLKPGAAGTLFDQDADMDDVVATILDLAVRGHLRIREVPPDGLMGAFDPASFAGHALKTLGLYRNDWQLERLPQDPAGLERPEIQILNGVFDGRSTRRMSDLHNEFYKELPEIIDSLYDAVVRAGLFRRNPRTTRRIYWVVGAAIAGLGFLLGMALDHLLLGVCLVLSGAVVLLFSFGMPRMTLKGARLRRELAGLEEYIRRAEKAELEFREAPEKTPAHFSEILPYAVALDVSDLWVEQFEPVLASSPPTWYV
ncbi:MAG TPA: DUF2207 domain-containing protein, partial [Gemmatimonadota bacterium]|nr:DUF2207 domain-containing protein [Gemmatimonadota bacterium]